MERLHEIDPIPVPCMGRQVPTVQRGFNRKRCTATTGKDVPVEEERGSTTKQVCVTCKTSMGEETIPAISKEAVVCPGRNRRNGKRKPQQLLPQAEIAATVRLPATTCTLTYGKAQNAILLLRALSHEGRQPMRTAWPASCLGNYHPVRERRTHSKRNGETLQADVPCGGRYGRV